MIALTLLCVTAQGSGMPQSYLLRMTRTLEAIRADLPAMRTLADQAAGRLANGGKLWAMGPRSLVGEFCGRAGGFMMIRALGDNKPGPKDVVLAFADREGSTPVLPILDGPLVITFSDRCFGILAGSGSTDSTNRNPETSAAGATCVRSHAAETGVSPTLAEAACGWVFTGELVAALTRLGRMPVIYETIGAYGGNARIEQYKNGEIAWHEDLQVPKIEPGVLGGRYIDTVCLMLKRVEKEGRKDFDRAGVWSREARAGGKRLTMLSMGHIFPDEISSTEIGKLFSSAVWNAGFRHSRPEIACDRGDVIVHIGYQHPPDDLLRLAKKCGARAVYVSVRPDRDFTRDKDVIWIDPMWDWPDACVQLEGYDIPILAASGVINGSIAWEIYRLAR